MYATVEDLIARVGETEIIRLTDRVDPPSGVVGVPSTRALDDGVVIDGPRRLLTFRLKAPDPDFPRKSASPSAAIVPSEAPARDAGSDPLPGAGPRAVAEFTPGVRPSLIRNPLFKQRSAREHPDEGPDEIVREFGTSGTEAVAAPLAGKAEWTRDPPPERLAELRAAKGVRLHVDTAETAWWATLGGSSPLVDARVRRAFDLALDRNVMVGALGGPEVASPPRPPGGGGARRTVEASAADARALVKAGGFSGREVAVFVEADPVAGAVGRSTANVLRGLGFRAVVEPASATEVKTGGVVVSRRDANAGAAGDRDVPLVVTRRVEVLSVRAENFVFGRR